MHDPQSNLALDSFGARYYSSQIGRFLTPDFSSDPGHPEPIPYANLENPQSLNLYSYVLNNPVSNSDPDGHLCLLGHNFLGSFGGSCSSKPSKLPVKEGGDYDPTGLDPFSKSMLATANREADGVGQAIAFAGAHPVLTNIVLAAVPGGEEEEAAAGAVEVIKPSAGQIRQGEQVLAKDGAPAVQKAIKSLEGVIQEHAGKIESATGYTSSMDKEIRNFKQLLQAYKSVLGGGQ